MTRSILIAMLLALSGFAHADAPVTGCGSVTLADGSTASVYQNAFYQTLYVFDPDLSAPGSSVCTGGCAEKWPPLLVTDEEAAALTGNLSTMKRASGLLQVTIDDRPVYTFFMDRSTTDAYGDGLGGVWHAAVIAR